MVTKVKYTNLTTFIADIATSSYIVSYKIMEKQLFVNGSTTPYKNVFCHIT